MGKAQGATATKVETKERPVLFSGPMVRAILEGRKTQTRRVIRPQPSHHEHNTRAHFHTGEEEQDDWTFDIGIGRWRCPYGKLGDRLWVRETWALAPEGVMARDTTEHVIFRAGYPKFTPTGFGPWKPSIFMPRKHSRITLGITDIRVERLMDISDDDIRAEGITEGDGVWDGSLRAAWANGWNDINERRGYSWLHNPWVWVIIFQPTGTASGLFSVDTSASSCSH